MKVISTIIFDLDDSCEGRKPNIAMIDKYLSSRISEGIIDENQFRCKVIMKIKKYSLVSWIVE